MTVRTSTTDAGFTLIEALVVLALAALAFALVPGTIRVGHQALRAAAQSEQLHSDRQATASLTRHLSGARPLRVTGADGVSKLAFEGAPDRVRFVTEFAAGPSGGGLYLVDVGVDPGTANLTISHQPYPIGRDAPPDAGRAVLVRAKAMSLRYFGYDPISGAGAWRNTWDSTDRLPALIEIVITPPGEAGRINPVLVTLPLGR